MKTNNLNKKQKLIELITAMPDTQNEVIDCLYSIASCETQHKAKSATEDPGSLYYCESAKLLHTIKNSKRIDALRYLYIIIYDLAEELGIDISDYFADWEDAKKQLNNEK